MDQVPDVVARSKQRFTPEQVTSTLSLLDGIASVEGVTARQRELITNVEDALGEVGKESAWQ